MPRPDLAAAWAAALASTTALVALPAPAPAVAAQPAAGVRTVTLRTVPALAGVRVLSGGRIVRTDRHGRVTVTVRLLPHAGGRLPFVPPKVLASRVRPGVEARFGGFFDGGRTIALSLYTRTRLQFENLQGERVPPREIRAVTLKSSTGVTVKVNGNVTPSLHASRVVRERTGVRSKPIQYAVERVDVAGGNAVHRAKRRFLPLRTHRLPIRLLLFSARFTARDALFGYPAGSAVQLEYPNGRIARIPLEHGDASADALPRGEYRVRVVAPGYTFERPVSLSRDQLVDLKVVSYLDLVVVFGGIGALAVALVLVRRPWLVRRLRAVGTTVARKA